MPARIPAPPRILGAGPAGAALALLVARSGLAPELRHTKTRGRRVPEETVLASAAPRLEALGLIPFLRESAAWGTRRHGIIWNGDDIKWRDETPETRGFKIARDPFDRHLRRLAHAAGAAIRTMDRPGPLAGDFEVIATGRYRPHATANPETLLAGAETIALGAGLADAGDDGEVTLIEAVPEGWWWWLPLADGTVAITLFADAAELRARGRDPVWRAARSHALGPARQAPDRPDYGTTATPRLRVHPAAMLVGDAASIIDPLSSQGLEKALASAEEGARCLREIHERPDEAAAILDHQRSWEKRLFVAHLRRTTELYQQETRFTDAPFWCKRRTLPEALVPPAALDPGSRVMMRPDLEKTRGYRADGPRLAKIEGWRDPGTGGVIERVGDVALASLAPILETRGTLEEMAERAARRGDLFLLSKSEVKAAIRELWRLGLLTADRAAPASR